MCVCVCVCVCITVVWGCHILVLLTTEEVSVGHEPRRSGASATAMASSFRPPLLPISGAGDELGDSPPPPTVATITIADDSDEDEWLGELCKAHHERQQIDDQNPDDWLTELLNAHREAQPVACSGVSAKACPGVPAKAKACPGVPAKACPGVPAKAKACSAGVPAKACLPGRPATSRSSSVAATVRSFGASAPAAKKSASPVMATSAARHRVDTTSKRSSGVSATVRSSGVSATSRSSGVSVFRRMAVSATSRSAISQSSLAPTTSRSSGVSEDGSIRFRAWAEVREHVANSALPLEKYRTWSVPGQDTILIGGLRCITLPPPGHVGLWDPCDHAVARLLMWSELLGPIAFKVGIASDTRDRWHCPEIGYAREERWHFMDVVLEGPANRCRHMEMALVSRCKGVPGCYNVKPGGEGVNPTRTHMCRVYWVIAEAGLGLGLAAACDQRRKRARVYSVPE